MKVPVYEPQVAQQPQGSVSVPNMATPPVAAFGGGVAEATRGLGETVSGLGEKLAAHVIERQRQDQQAQVVQAETDFRQKLQDVMYSTEQDPDNNNKPKGVFNRLRADAAGATVDYDSRSKALMDETAQTLTNPIQQRELMQRMNETYGTYRRYVIHHEATQDDENRKDIYESNMKQRIDDAGILSDPKDLNKAIDSAHSDTYRHMRDYGFDEGVIAQKMGELSGNMVKSAIKGVLEDDPAQAQKILDGVSDANLPGAQRGQLQKAIDVATKQHKITRDKEEFESWNDNEAQVVGDLANGKLTQLALDGAKDHISPDFYNLASHALKNTDVHEGTDQQKSSRATTLLAQFSRITDADSDKRTKEMINYRKNVLAHATQLKPDDFNSLLSLSDPNFVKELTPEKKSHYQAALDYVKEFYAKYNSGNPMNALMNFTKTALNPGTKPEDIPAVARAAIQGDALKEHPSLIGQPDLSNNVVDQKNGIQQVIQGTTTLKPGQKISTTASQKIIAVNKKTKERMESNDGGKTWQRIP